MNLSQCKLCFASLEITKTLPLVSTQTVVTFIDLCESLHLKLGTTWRKKLQNYHDHSFTGACMNITRIRWKTKMFAVVFYCLCGISWKKLGVRFDYSLHFSPLIKKGLFSKQFLFLKVFLRLIHASWVKKQWRRVHVIHWYYKAIKWTM